MDEQAIREALRAAAAPFATASPPPALELVCAPLFCALAPAGAAVYPLALEFVYEGYLAHYREPRVLAADTTLSTRLLAGDHFDASGLRLVARQGDLDAVKLLTRLMASLSWLRAEERPFAYDDDLWALCVAGIASGAAGGHAVAALHAFDEVARLFEHGRAERLPDLVRRSAASLWLRDPAPLRAALRLDAVTSAAADTGAAAGGPDLPGGPGAPAASEPPLASEARADDTLPGEAAL